MFNNRKSKKQMTELTNKKENDRFVFAGTGAVVGNVTKGVSEAGRGCENTFEKFCVRTWGPECRYCENTKNMTNRAEKKLNYCSRIVKKIVSIPRPNT